MILTVGITTKCNAKCKFCERNYYNFNHSDLNLNLLKTIEVDHIVFNGNFGDPTFHPDLLNFLKETKVRSRIATNGSLKNDKFWIELAKLNTIVIFGIDGLEDTHKRYRNTDYKQVLKNLKIYIEHGGYAIWQYIVFDYNENQIEEALQLSKKLGCKEFKVLQSHVYDDDFKKPKLEIKDKEKTIIHYDDGELKKIDRIKRCAWENRNHFFIDEYGYVFRCFNVAGQIRYNKDSKELFLKYKNEINLKENSMEDILKSNYFKDVKKTKGCIYKCKGN